MLLLPCILVLATLATAQSEENDTVNKKEDIKSTVHDFFNVGSSEQLTTSTHHLSGIENFQLTFVDDLISSSETLARRNLFPNFTYVFLILDIRTTSQPHPKMRDLVVEMTFIVNYCA